MNVRNKTTRFWWEVAACMLVFLSFFWSAVPYVSKIQILLLSGPTFDDVAVSSSLRNTKDMSSSALNTAPEIDTFSIDKIATSLDSDRTAHASTPPPITGNTNTAPVTPTAMTSNTRSTYTLTRADNTKPAVIDSAYNLHGKVLVATWVFGEEAMNKKYLRMFVESAKTSGIDYVIIGDHVPPFELPNNFRFLHIQWKDLIDRLFDRGVIPSPPPNVSKYDLPIYNIDNYRKICDYKPLFGYLFPEVLKGYDFWGHCDNDMLMGNVAKFLLKTNLYDYDCYAYYVDVSLEMFGETEVLRVPFVPGPFSIYRNAKVTNELFKMLTTVQRLETFLSAEYKVFDEEGDLFWQSKAGNVANLDAGMEMLERSMSGLLYNHAAELGIRMNTNNKFFWWDGDHGWLNETAADGPQRPAWCHPCIYNHKYGLRVPGAFHGVEETHACHFLYSKHIIEESLKNQEDNIERLIEKGEWQVDCANGYSFDPL